MQVSLIVCTRNRADALAALLERLETVPIPDGMDVEMVVVDNGSTDSTPEVLASAAGRLPMPLAVVTEQRPGLARARNRGLAQARGDIVAFTDDDCLPAPDFWTAVASRFRAATGPLLVGGRVLLHDEKAARITVKYDTEFDEVRRAGDIQGFLHGCNMIAHRRLFGAVGGFDERFGAGTPLHSSEDTDFVFRVFATVEGARIVYDPAIVVYHDHGRVTREAVVDLMERYKIGRGALYAKHLKERRWSVLGLLVAQVGPPLGRALRQRSLAVLRRYPGHLWQCRLLAVGVSRYLAMARSDDPPPLGPAKMAKLGTDEAGSGQ